MRSETRKASTVIAATSPERYIRDDLAGHRGHHDWKLGVDGVFNPVHERLQYAITDPAQFDPGTKQQFQFPTDVWNIEPPTLCTGRDPCGQLELKNETEPMFL